MWRRGGLRFYPVTGASRRITVSVTIIGAIAIRLIEVVHQQKLYIGDLAAAAVCPPDEFAGLYG